MRLRPWAFASVVVVSFMLLVGGIVVLAQPSPGLKVQVGSYSSVAIVAVDSQTVVEQRSAFDIKDDELKLRLFLLANDNPNASFVLGALDGSQWQPVSREIEFGPQREAEIVLRAEDLPPRKNVALAVFERHGGQCSSAIDLINHPKGIHIPPFWTAVAFMLIGLGGLIWSGVVGYCVGKLIDWLGGKFKRSRRPQAPTGAEVKT